MFARLPSYQAFLASSLRVARDTVLLAHIPQDRLAPPPQADLRPFLD